MRKKSLNHTPDTHTNSNTIDNPQSNPQSDRANRGGSRPRSRRKFLGDVGGITAATLVAGVAGTPVLESVSFADDLGASAMTPAARAEKAFNTRTQAALFQRILPMPDQPNNGDEDLYANRIGNFSKGLPHNQLGEVDRNAYESLLKAVTTEDPANFDAIILGGSFKLTSPQGGLAFEMQGADPGHVFQPPAPTFASAEEAGEIAENYWMALTRDVFFQDYEEHPLTIAAAEDLSKFQDFRGPKFPRANMRTLGLRRSGDELSVEAEEQFESQAIDSAPAQAETTASRAPSRQAQTGRITPFTLFRGNTPGDLVGPYISQFLWKQIPYGVQTISQKMRTVQPGVDYLTNYADWLAAQNGIANFDYSFDSTPRYIRNMRDLAEWVHIDVLFQAYFNAMLILMGMGAPVDDGNPYKTSRNQAGFATFGPPHIAALLCGAASPALKSVWYQKWKVHRRLRPEAFAGRIHNHLTRAATYPIHPDILNSKTVE